jgi:DNA invertase Pin-like site-specific DNA recombinase
MANIVMTLADGHIIRKTNGGSDVIVGHGRVSTLHQGAGLEAQEAPLAAAGCQRLFCEEVSSIGERAELDKALELVRASDTFGSH